MAIKFETLTNPSMFLVCYSNIYDLQATPVLFYTEFFVFVIYLSNKQNQKDGINPYVRSNEIWHTVEFKVEVRREQEN